jgi:hypothetical protein
MVITAALLDELTTGLREMVILVASLDGLTTDSETILPQSLSASHEPLGELQYHTKAAIPSCKAAPAYPYPPHEGNCPRCRYLLTRSRIFEVRGTL